MRGDGYNAATSHLSHGLRKEAKNTMRRKILSAVLTNLIFSCC